MSLGRMRILQRRGYLALMDSTHNTNNSDWFLYTIMVRTEYGKWMPCAHMLSKTEDGDIVGAFLCQVKKWCGGPGGWLLRYIITDDSAAEQRGVKLAFKGLVDGEQEVDHFLCRKHSERTMNRKLSSDACKEARKHLYAALYFRLSEPGCDDSLKSAISAAPNQKVKDYIQKEWVATKRQWAYYARQHSSLLLQVPGTNPVESWHFSLKTHAEGKKSIRKFSLLGCASHVLRIGDQWEQRAKDEAALWRSTRSAECQDYPDLARFPGPVQELIVGQLKKGQQNAADGKYKKRHSPPLAPKLTIPFLSR